MTVVTPELLTRFDVSGPRYTSYPTADRFVDAFGEDEYVLALQQRRQSSVGKAFTSRFASRCATTAPATRSLPSTMIVLMCICAI